MKKILTICLLITAFISWANCPKALSVAWRGSYSDHGVFEADLPIALKIQVSGDDFTGHTLANSRLGRLQIQGTCTQKSIIFYLYQDLSDPTPPLSELSFINPNEISIQLNWQNAMIGGYGSALLEREKYS